MYGEIKAVIVIEHEREKRRETSPIRRIWLGQWSMFFIRPCFLLCIHRVLHACTTPALQLNPKKAKSKSRHAHSLLCSRGQTPNPCSAQIGYYPHRAYTHADLGGGDAAREPSQSYSADQHCSLSTPTPTNTHLSTRTQPREPDSRTLLLQQTTPLVLRHSPRVKRNIGRHLCYYCRCYCCTLYAMDYKHA